MEAKVTITSIKNTDARTDRENAFSLSSYYNAFFKNKRISDQEKIGFLTQLSVMLEARISLSDGLKILLLQASGERIKNVIGKLLDEVNKGNSFAHALAQQSGVFDNLTIVTAEVGEESGRLPEVFSSLAQHMEKTNALKKKFMQALAYPALVLTVAFGSVLFLLLFIVPSFAEMFRSFQVEIPMSTQIVLKVSELLTEYGVYLFGVGLLLIILLRQMFKSPTFKQNLEIISLKMPFIGDLLNKNLVARFCRTLGTMLREQVSLVDALGVTKRIFGTDEIKDEIDRIIRQVKSGRAVAEPLLVSKIFPPMVSQTIAVGEETSKLDSMLIKVAEYYEKEINNKVETLSTVIEPVIIVFLGLLVAVILVSMYMPMFDLVNVVGGIN